MTRALAAIVNAAAWVGNRALEVLDTEVCRISNDLSRRGDDL